MRHLTSGGFGAVYLAEHEGTGQQLALKVLADRARTYSQGAVERFVREAEITASLTHPNTVRVFDVGDSGSQGALFLAMEYLRGPNLEEVLRALDDRQVAMSEQQVIELAIPILNSLSEAHAAGLVHRDLKPSNIMLAQVAGNEPVVKVLDFGCSLVQGSTLTVEGNVFGTPGYMSPEQIRGEELDARSDLFGLGVLLHRCVTGRTPFEAEQPATLLYRYAHEQVPDPCDLDVSISEPFGKALLKAMALRRADRFNDAREMRRHLAAIAPRCGVSARSLRRSSPRRRDTLMAGTIKDTGRIQRLIDMVPGVPDLPGHVEELHTLSHEQISLAAATEPFAVFPLHGEAAHDEVPLDIGVIENAPAPASPPTEVGQILSAIAEPEFSEQAASPQTEVGQILSAIAEVERVEPEIVQEENKSPSGQVAASLERPSPKESSAAPLSSERSSIVEETQPPRRGSGGLRGPILLFLLGLGTTALLAWAVTAGLEDGVDERGSAQESREDSAAVDLVERGVEDAGARHSDAFIAVDARPDAGGEVSEAAAADGGGDSLMQQDGRLQGQDAGQSQEIFQEPKKNRGGSKKGRARGGRRTKVRKKTHNKAQNKTRAPSNPRLPPRLRLKPEVFDD